MSGVTDLMLALLSMNPQERNSAEQQINHVRDTDFPSFVTYLIAELRDPNAPADSRRMAGSLLKNNIALRLRNVEAREALENRWKSLDAALRAQVKEEVLMTLASTEHDVRYTAASIVGNLARIELPHGEWPDLLESLVNSATNGDADIQEAALTALGYICEETVTCEELEEHLAQYSTPILNAIVTGMTSGNNNIRFYATSALNNAMEFCDENMKEDEQRNYLIGVVCTTVREGEERTQKVAMQVLVKIADLYYPYLDQYIGDLFQLTQDAIMKGSSEDVALQGILFWISVCEMERELLENNNAKNCHGFAHQGSEQLCEIIQWALVQQDEGQTEEDWNVSIAAAKLLLALSETLRDDIKPAMLPWIYANINSADWHQREAAVMAFGCILAGPDPEGMIDTVAEALPNGLLTYITDSHELVQDTAGWVLCVVAELFPQTLLEVPENLSQLFNTIGPMLTGPSVPMALRAADIINNLALFYEDEEDLRSSALTPYFADICQGLLGAMDRPDGLEKLRGNAQEALNAVVDSAPADCMSFLMELVPEIQSRLQATFSMAGQGASETDIFLMQGLFCGTLNGVARKLKHEIAPVAGDIIAQLQQVFEQSDATVQDEALLCVGAVAHGLGEDFMPFLPQVMPYVLLGLRNTDEFDLCNVAVGVVGDIVSSVHGLLLDNGADDIMMAILEGLRSEGVNRDLKCTFLQCLGDFSLNLGPSFTRYLDDLMGVAGEMDNASREIDWKDDAELEDYVMGLWEAILAFYTGVAQCYKEDITPLMSYMPGMLHFALYVTQAAANAEDVFTAALGVIGDIANVIADADPATVNEAKSFLLVDDVYAAVKKALKDGDEATKKQARWTQRQIETIEKIR